MKFGISYYWRDPVDIFDLAEDFLELKVFEEDINENYFSWGKKLDEVMKDHDHEIAIHMPEYYYHPSSGELTLIDLASKDPKLHTSGMDIIKNLIDFGNNFSASKLILHPGGVTEKPQPADHEDFIKRLIYSLKEISGMDFQGEILIENMPWFYWRRDGRRWHCNICYTPQDFSRILEYCDGMVFDLSHGFLCDSSGSNAYLLEYANLYRDRIKYLHVSDSFPPDTEGLQIGEGHIDFEDIINKLEKEKLWILPEIWKGHDNFGEGFKIALERINNLI
jgi:N-acetylneuraminate synthase